MINMSKFNKRISRLTRNPLQNALVVGEGFDHLEDLLEIFQTVFLINEKSPSIRSRNLVYKENYDDLHLLVDISCVFFDLSKINDIALTVPVYSRWKSIVIVEGNDPIGRDYTQSLYNNGWKCTSQQGFFHVWELK